MPNFEVDYSYRIQEGGAFRLPAVDLEDAELEAKSYIMETFPDVENVQIEGIRQMAEGEPL